jgi:enamine deaminase RidA (YjgF/YER057c/UK114 family)
MSGSIPRRDVLVGGGLLLGSTLAPTAAGAARAPSTSGVEARLAELGIELPPPPRPMATYTTRVLVGDLLFVSGHGPATRITGKLGGDLDVEAGQAAARSTGLAMLATVRDALGTLDRVVRVVQIVGMVNCTPDFVEQPQVINGFSDLLVEVFGDELGRGARAAVGMVSLPAGIPVEIQALFQVRDAG